MCAQDANGLNTGRPVAIVLAPDRGAVSGVSTHLNLLLDSRLGEEFELVHFQVGREGRDESRPGRLARLVISPLLLAIAILRRNAALVHLNTSLNGGAYWRDLVYLIVAKACGAQILYQVHGGALPRQFFQGNRVLTAILRWMLMLPDAVVVLAQSELEAYRSFVPLQQILVLPNGIDCASYTKPAQEASAPAMPLRLCYIGRLAREKGLYELLQAVRLAHADGIRVRLVIAGSGPDEAGLQRSVVELGLETVVTFAGPVFGNRKTELLRAAHVSVLASHGEGLPYALLESMAAGVPVIATRVGAIPDVMLGGVHGLFVPVQDPLAIAQAIAKLAADRGLLARMSAACRARIADGYAIDRLAGELSRLYAELCAAKRIKVLTRS
ncbi:MAG TPA: glycosyltransferase family 4 protein [Burkholderiales bacterium]|nr:glycosyltransferase family 4 protein [Burkholderiales bacterium]